jgi:hypothetical protein
MKMCEMTIPEDCEGLEEALRSGLADSGVNFQIKKGDVDQVEIEQVELSHGETMFEGQNEVGTTALFAMIGQRATQIEQAWREQNNKM